MIVKCIDILNAIEPIKGIMNKPFPARTAFNIARLARELEKEYDLLIETRKKIIYKYAKKNEKNELVIENDLIQIQDELQEKCRKELQDFSLMEIELNVSSLKQEDFNELDFTPSQILSLMPFFE